MSSHMFECRLARRKAAQVCDWREQVVVINYCYSVTRCAGYNSVFQVKNINVTLKIRILCCYSFVCSAWRPNYDQPFFSRKRDWPAERECEGWCMFIAVLFVVC